MKLRIQSVRVGNNTHFIVEGEYTRKTFWTRKWINYWSCVAHYTLSEEFYDYDGEDWMPIEFKSVESAWKAIDRYREAIKNNAPYCESKTVATTTID